jgi:uncharacterized protein (TIGR00725 family)
VSDTLHLDRVRAVLSRADGRVFSAALLDWVAPMGAEVARAGASTEPVTPAEALRWLAAERPGTFRVPVAVVGPRNASEAQCALADTIGAGLAELGLAVVCGGRSGVMQAVCEGVARAGGISIGLLPDAEPTPANPFARLVLATGIGEARNALIARAALCLVAIGDSFGTLSEVALGRQFGKRVIGLAGAARVDGVLHVPHPAAALDAVAEVALGLAEGDR